MVIEQLKAELVRPETNKM